jgi:hypothetical protein
VLRPASRFGAEISARTVGGSGRRSLHSVPTRPDRRAGSKLSFGLSTCRSGTVVHRARIARYGTAWQNRGRRRVSRAAVGLVKGNPADRPARSSGASSGGTTVAEAAGQGDARAVTQSTQTARCASSSPSSVVAGTASRSSRSPEPPRPRVTRLRSPAGRRWSRSSGPSGSRPTPRGRATWPCPGTRCGACHAADGVRHGDGGVGRRELPAEGRMHARRDRVASGLSHRGRAARATAVRGATAPVELATTPEAVARRCSA